MKRILTLSFIIFSPFITLQSWALPSCPSNQNAYKDNCFGIYSWGDGEKYIGEWKDNKFHGQGTYTFKNGNLYVGDFKEGKRDGIGIFTYENGNKYVGEFKNGTMDGQGTFTYPNGDKRVGVWRDGKPVN